MGAPRGPHAHGDPRGIRPQGRDHNGIQPTGARSANFYFSFKNHRIRLSGGEEGRGQGVEGELPSSEKLPRLYTRRASRFPAGRSTPRPCPPHRHHHHHHHHHRCRRRCLTGGTAAALGRGTKQKRKRRVAAVCSAAKRALLPAHRSRGGARRSLRGRSGDDHAATTAAVGRWGGGGVALARLGPPLRLDVRQTGGALGG